MSSKAIAILNYNGAHHLQRFLPSVIEHTSEDATVIVIDNGSTDDSLTTLENEFPGVQVIALPENLGFAGGYNKGIQQISYDWIILLNSDVEVTKNWDVPLWTTLASEDTAAVQGKIRSLENPSCFEYAGAAGGFLDILAYPYCDGRILDVVEQDIGQYDDEKEIFWATGAAMAIKRDCFVSIGGFNDRFFAHMEEIDLCWRLKRAGYKIMYQPKSIVFHLGGGTLSYQSSRKVYLNFRNSLMTNFFNSSGFRSLVLYLMRLLLDGVAALNFVFARQLKNVPAVFKAHIYFIQHIFQLIREKKDIKRRIEDLKIGPPNLTGRSRFSIIVNYYLLGRKTIQDIAKEN